MTAPRTGSMEPASLAQHAGDRVGADRLAEVEALDLVACVLPHEVALFGRLDAFGGDLELQAARNRDNRTRNGRVPRIAVDVAHERLVDLEPVELEALEVAEIGIAGAEVVDGE